MSTRLIANDNGISTWLKDQVFILTLVFFVFLPQEIFPPPELFNFFPDPIRNTFHYAARTPAKVSPSLFLSLSSRLSLSLFSLIYFLLVAAPEEALSFAWLRPRLRLLGASCLDKMPNAGRFLIRIFFLLPLDLPATSIALPPISLKPIDSNNNP